MSTRLAAVCLVALAAGCSALGFAYNNADTWLRWQAARYLALDAGQARELDARIDAFLAWHRARALPQYSRLAEEAGARLAHGVSQADLVWGYDALRTQFREGLRRAGADLRVVLDRVRPAQIEQLERRLAEDNRKFAREHLAGAAEERRSRRLRRTTRLLGDWLGELSDAQRERVRQFSEQARMLSVRQRQHAIARLRGFARDFELLAAAR